MQTIKLTLMYDGTNYVGWQIQPNGLSVQALVQDAVRKMTGEETHVHGASRTDAGVHALGQVAHFETSRDIPPEGFQAGLNSILPEDVSVVLAEAVPQGFHARKEAKGKRDVYRAIVSKERNPFLRNRAWLLRQRPDMEEMQRAAGHLVGEHDFASFRAAGCGSRHAVRTIARIDVASRAITPEMMAGEGELIEFLFDGNGFVRHMIRNIVGTLVDVGLGKIEAGDVLRIIAARERIEAGRCAPASGLYLVRVFY
jgi:tRNA pseudouridine38-40 synthase